jgi:hypothetical protein
MAHSRAKFEDIPLANPERKSWIRIASDMAIFLRDNANRRFANKR